MFDEKKAAAKIAAPRHVFALVSLAAILGPEQSLVRLRAHYVRTEAVCLTRFCSCPRLYKNARRKQHTEMRHIAVSRPDLWQSVPRLLSVSCVCVCVWGGGAFAPFPPCPFASRPPPFIVLLLSSG